ncbi:FAD-dependent monooxygenase [Actinacidiphila acididurans]|uniref:FAD-dependent monooxygenase n=1 Tax=Actinacidiphila acididurans TaxID=2784346 RepID=A0ABS2TT16_9ACTN|nr:FAD-dependent monooxygenase [Actinacidiphila acididurans]MBM9506464.1 FAD-dependent monooxygenase [Actinacidiphila acididurans]
MNSRVIVVGAGPVGLMLAGELRLGGADVVVYDKLAAPSGESRALGFTKRVAELLDQRGLLDRLGELRWGRGGHFGGVPVDLGMLDESHHGVLGLPQSRTEEVLAGRLSELGVPVHRGCAAVDLTQDADGVTVVLDGPQGRLEERARYVVGCDGPNGAVRAAAGIPAPGWAATRGMYMADVTGVELRQRPTGERIPGGHMILSVSLGDGYYRVLVHDKSLKPPASSDDVTFKDVADAWQRMTGESIHHGSARWTAAFDNAAGLAADYRRGRVLLAGDAAHATPPLAGWGLSTGIQDAANLGWKLAAVATGRAPQRLLDTYHSERHPLGEQLLRNTHAASMLYLTGQDIDPLRAVLGELMTHKDTATHFAGMVSGLTVRYDMGPGGHPLLGLRMPPARELHLPGGARTRVGDLLRPGRGVFIDTTAPAGHAARVEAGWAGRVDVVTGTWAAPGGDGAGPAPHAVLIRPDGYIAWAAPEPGDLEAALDRWFGAARVTATA